MNEYLNPTKFFLELPLYSKIEFEKEDVFQVLELLFFDKTIDAYCLKCKRESTFHGINHGIPQHLSQDTYKREIQKRSAMIPTSGHRLPDKPSPPLIPTDIIETSFSCGRDKSHTLRFLYLAKNKILEGEDGKPDVRQSIEKVGQYPSLAELHLPAIQKYRGVLSSEDYSDLSRGIGLAAHDVGVGAYIYLRRVFERLVEQAHAIAKLETSWDEDAYQAMRMTERVKALKNHLPNFLVDHPEMYSLLSKGIHELSEKICLRHFPSLRVGIELILDEKIEQDKKERKIAEASKAIKTAAGEVNKA